jgi:hypothetical protein
MNITTHVIFSAKLSCVVPEPRELKKTRSLRLVSVAEIGKWLRSVVQGYFNYHAVPGNINSLQSFRAQLVWHLVPPATTAEPEESDAPGNASVGLSLGGVVLHPSCHALNARHLR